MTVSAHDARHVYHGATRNAHIADGDTAPVRFYDILCPHMRSVQARAESMEETLHGYLLRRGPRSLSQLAAKAGTTKPKVKERMLKRPDLFRKVGRLWEAIPQEKMPPTERQRMGATLAAQIDAYLLGHGPSTVREITDGIGHPDIRYVSAIIAKPPCKARRTKNFKKGCQVWEVPSGIS